MSILSKYLLRLHAVPFAFALAASTSIMLVNQIAKRLPDLLGKGLPWRVIVEVFALSIPFLVAMTLPMAVLIAVLYAVSRLTAENEVTALRAGGVSLSRFMRPLLLGGAAMTVIGFGFNDQILPRANHKLRTLLSDISQTKPTFSLEEQVINEVQRRRFFLRANRIDQATYELGDVTIYDLGDPARKRTIFADRGHMGFGPDREDLLLTLFDGTMHESSRSQPHRFQVMNFREKILRVEGIGRTFARSATSRFKGDREMRVCEMDSVIVAAQREMMVARHRAAGIERNALRALVGLAPVPIDSLEPVVQPRLYCRALDAVGAWLLPEAAVAQDTVPFRKDEATARGEPVEFVPVTPAPRRTSATLQRDRARSAEVRSATYRVEVHKKYAIAFASFVFVLIGVPVAMAFPRAGVGLVIGASLGVFSVYYVGLIGGESLANKLVLPAFWAMWAPNFIFGAVGLLLLWRTRTFSGTSRGSVGGWRRRPRKATT